MIWLTLLLAAAASPDADAVRAGAEGLAQSFPWYDASTDDLRVLAPVAPGELVLDQQQTWQAPSGARQRSKEMAPWRTLWRGMQVAAWVVLALLLALLAAALAWAYWHSESRGARRSFSAPGDTEFATADRLQELPLPIAPTEVTLLQQARRWAQQGQTRMALIYLYSHVLLWLDDRDVIRLQRGKTNRQYLAELPQQAAVRQEFQSIMERFEQAYFGKLVPSSAQFEQCCQEMTRLQTAVELASE